MPLKIVVPSLGLRFTKLFTNFFCIDVTFEMRTVLSVIRLFNANLKIVGQHFYIKQKWRGREQDSGETERECVCERQGVVEKES